MLLTDLLAKVNEGNFELSRSAYTCSPRSWRTFSTRSFLASAVVFDFCLLMWTFHRLLASRLDRQLLRLACLDLFGLLLLPYQLLVLRGALLPGQLLREPRDEG